MGTPVTVIQSIADRLDRACQTKTPTAPIQESDGISAGISDPKTAYAIQRIEGEVTFANQPA